MGIDVLLGLQWGDEGKGKIVDYLAPKYNIVARFQGGPNAGQVGLILLGRDAAMAQIQRWEVCIQATIPICAGTNAYADFRDPRFSKNDFSTEAATSISAITVHDSGEARSKE